MPKMQNTVDIVIFTVQNDALVVLLVKRKYEPFKGLWAIPGGYVGAEESLEQAARRELKEETGLSNVFLEQLYSFGDPNRDPRGRVISIAYFSILSSAVEPVAGTDASEAFWHPMAKLPFLAFDHERILAYALERLRNKLEYTTVGFKLLPEKFTLSELQTVYEAVLGKALDKRNFRRKMLILKVLEPLKEWKRKGVTRPARYYSFSQKRFEKLKDRGILFPF